MLPNEKFKIEIKTEQGQQKVYLKGIIDEDTDFAQLQKTRGALTINFKDVQSINSCGIRTWVNFLKDMSGRDIRYEECPPLIVRQMNMVPSFVGDAEVLSVYVPYVSDETDEEKLVLITNEKFADGNFEIPEVINTEDGEMELDGHPQQYFAFARKAG